MGELKIKPQKIRSTAQDMNHIAKQMRELESQIRNIQYGLGFEVAQKERVRQRLKTAEKDTADQYKGIYNSTSTLNNIVNTYETTERGLAGSTTPRYDMIRDTVLDNIKEAIILGGSSLGTSLNEHLPVIGPGMLIGKILDGTSPGYTYEHFETKEKYGGEIKLPEGIKQGEKTFVSINNSNDELKQSDIKAFKLWDKSWKDTKSFFHSEDAIGDKDDSHISYKFDVLKRETSAEIYAGVYDTDSVTGAKQIRGAFGGSLGFTMSALSASAESQLGNSDFGVYGKAEMSAGKVEAKATGVVGVRDAEGNFNPTVHGKVSAEAIAAEVSGKAGVKVLGADIGVKGSLNIGVGAHAEAGIKNGIFSLDVGASFGIGGSVKLEVDIGGVVNAVSGTAQSVWSTVTDWFR